MLDGYASVETLRRSNQSYGIKNIVAYAGGWAVWECGRVILLHASAVIITSVSHVGQSMQHSLPGIA